MTNREFIRAAALGHLKGPRTCGNLRWDGDTLYSYGRHYPLLVRAFGKWWVNDRGYSNTTARHIAHARAFADFSLHLNGNALEWCGPWEDTIRKYLLAECGDCYSARQLVKPRQNKRRERLAERWVELCAAAKAIGVDPEAFPPLSSEAAEETSFDYNP